MSSLPVLGYWDVRGLAQPIRYMLHYAGVKFIDKRYAFGDPENMQKNWHADKFNLGLDFPNLPYYFDGDIKITQSIAVTRYLARKYGLMAMDDQSLARQNMLEQQIRDYQYRDFGKLLMDPDFENNKINYVKNQLPAALKQFSDFLGENEWFSGDKLTYVDFMAYELFDTLRIFSEETVKLFPKLISFIEKFEKITNIEKYLNSDEFKPWPLFGPFVKWGHSK